MSIVLHHSLCAILFCHKVYWWRLGRLGRLDCYQGTVNVLSGHPRWMFRKNSIEFFIGLQPYLYYYYSGCTLKSHGHMSFLECSMVTWPCHVTWLTKSLSCLCLYSVACLELFDWVFKCMGNLFLLEALTTWMYPFLNWSSTNTCTSSLFSLNNEYTFLFFGMNPSFSSMAWSQAFYMGILSDSLFPNTLFHFQNLLGTSVVRTSSRKRFPTHLNTQSKISKHTME